MRRRTGLALLAACGACVERDPPKKKIDPAYVEKNVLAAEPAAIENRVDADLDGKVIYLGNDVEPALIAPGKSASIVHYWKVIEPPGDDWKVFTHLLGAGSEWMNLDYSDMRAGYPPGKWKAGDIIRDEQTFTVDDKWASPTAQVAVGLWRGGDRMAVKKGPVDKENRVLAFRFRVESRARSFNKVPSYMIRRARGPITIDGVAGEEDWKAAPPSPAFTVAEAGPELPGSAVARLLWDDVHLYAFIEVQDGDVHSQYRKQDDPLWKEDVVELFIDADRNRSGYVELQVNPRNAHFDAWFPVNRSKPHHFEWTSGMKSAVVVRGTIDDRGDKDQGWSAEIAIPLADVKGMDAAMVVSIPPQVGDRWRLNVIRVDKAKGAGGVAASSWSPITIRDFHALGRMLTVVFADQDGKLASGKDEPAAPDE